VATLGIFKEAFVESSTEHCNFLSDKKWSDSNLKDRRALCGYYSCFLGISMFCLAGIWYLKLLCFGTDVVGGVDFMFPENPLLVSDYW